MKVAIITDSHFGVRGDNLIFANYISRFYKEVFLPYLDDHKIRYVIHCGDIVDRRKFVNFLTARTLHEALVKPLADRAIQTYYVIGNHDIYFRESLQVNSMRELYGDRPMIGMNIIEKPQTIYIGGDNIDLYPWICKENENESYKLMKNPQAKIALGHFEFAGFEMQKGQVMYSGMNHEEFNQYMFVGSGHLHERSKRNNVQYFGCPYQLTWADYDCPRGFHILDTERVETEFVYNPITMYERIEYNDEHANKPTDIVPDLTAIKNKIVKLVVMNKTKPELFDILMGEIEHIPLSLKVVEDLIKVELNEVDVSPTEDMLSILLKYANVAETSERVRLSTLLTKLHNRALEMQGVE